MDCGYGADRHKLDINYKHELIGRCSDTSGNVNTNDTTITFSINNQTYNLSNFTSLITNWLGIGDNNSDLNNDGVVNTRDLGIMMSNWGE